MRDHAQLRDLRRSFTGRGVVVGGGGGARVGVGGGARVGVAAVVGLHDVPGNGGVFKFFLVVQEWIAVQVYVGVVTVL